MCGIVGFTGVEQAAPILLRNLQKLEYRGYDSAGIAVECDGKIVSARAVGKLVNLIEQTEGGKTITGTCGIGHTRWATHGSPSENNAHPHMSNNNKFAVVHNGIIENYIALRTELTELGYQFQSETDTEVVAHLLEYYDNGDMKATVMKTVSRLQGSYALGIVCSDHPGELYAVKNQSPLILGVGINEFFFSSDVTALITHTRNVIYLDDGEFAHITEEGIQIYDEFGKEIQKKISRIDWSLEDAEKGGYDHFMLKEIMEQPKALKSAVEPRIINNVINLSEMGLSDDDLKKIDNIIITACGSAYHAGVVGGYVIEDLCHIPVRVEVASELRYRNPPMNERSLLVVISQSGETADTIAALKLAKESGIKTLAIVNVVDSTISKLADGVLYTNAGPEIAVATTKGYTTQVAVISLFAVYLSKLTGKISDEYYSELVADIKSLPERCQRVIDLNTKVEKLAKQYYNNQSLFFIGRNIDYAVSLEASLKLKEISYIHSEAYAAGELKHGTIALIEPNRLVIALACYEKTFDKTMSNIKEVKARGAKVLGVAQEDNKRIISEVDSTLFIPQITPILMPIIETVPMQLFAYYVARENGCDIDKPKNLAKSVTVE